MGDWLGCDWQKRSTLYDFREMCSLLDGNGLEHREVGEQDEERRDADQTAVFLVKCRTSRRR